MYSLWVAFLRYVVWNFYPMLPFAGQLTLIFPDFVDCILPCGCSWLSAWSDLESPGTSTLGESVQAFLRTQSEQHLLAALRCEKTWGRRVASPLVFLQKEQQCCCCCCCYFCPALPLESSFLGFPTQLKTHNSEQSPRPSEPYWDCLGIQPFGLGNSSVLSVFIVNTDFVRLPEPYITC